MTAARPQHNTSSEHRHNGWLTLGVVVLAVAVIWTVVLPWLGTQPRVRARIDRLERQGIDPAALFYSDIQAMPRLEAELAAARTEHPDAFWGGGDKTSD